MPAGPLVTAVEAEVVSVVVVLEEATSEAEFLISQAAGFPHRRPRSPVEEPVGWACAVAESDSEWGATLLINHRRRRLFVPPARAER
jgi:hypothetical protein